VDCFKTQRCLLNSPAPLAGNTGLYLSRPVSAKQSGWLQNLWTDAGTCVHCINTCAQYQPLWPATWSSAFIDTWANISQNVIDETVDQWSYVQAWGKRISLWTSAELKPALFRANTLHNRLFSVYRGKHVVSRYFRRSYLKANEVSKSEGTRKVKYAHHFWKCTDAVDRKLSKLVHACRSYSLPKLARLFWDTVSECRLLPVLIVIW